MSPELALDGWAATREAGSLVLTHRERGELVLLGLAARLLDLVDGRRSPTELARLLAAVPEDIFCALDELADHGLLRARVSPPAAVRRRTRREVLGVLVGAAAAGLVPPTAAPLAAPLAPRPDDDRLLAAPPHEHGEKEARSKAEQHRKLGAAPLAAPFQVVIAEERGKAEADLLGAYEAAAKRPDSPSEAADKRRVELAPGLAAAREADRKRAVAPLLAQEEAAKRDLDRRARDLTGPAAALSAREQQAKLAGEFGPAHEATHQALVTALARRRLQPGEQRDKQVQQAQDARWRADIAEGRSEEQDDKAVLRAAAAPGPTREQDRQRAEAARERHRADRLAQFHQRQAALALEARERAARAARSEAAEQAFKATAVEEAGKRDTVRVELRAREHAAKSRPDPH
ncbi:hypothetical protein SAMN02745121_05104 [Nannocystis exedens]|uniref:Uncharacterized protein n=1 Tax=Nannocystis exedens TaxID=54 RepID=A0A1I2CEV6_9BACT|nr:hypothetical protein [Nannocystis exedens]PCC68329.1 hypothetical protein NAEX_01339 [Nannocystis exedens]SFE66907.1 hypothetical protein SAMN02745121_05104 [Nannocystis exedens]